MIAFTFPGQGSQKPGMGEPWVDHPSWELVDEASDAAGPRRRAPAARRRRRRAAGHPQRAAGDVRRQPRRARRRRAPRRRARRRAPATASASTPRSVASGALGLRRRASGWSPSGARPCSDAATEHAGTMAAVLGLDDDEVEIACDRVDGDVWVANYNAPGQVVIAGAPEAIDAAPARRQGARRQEASCRIAVSGAFHTPFMAPARDRLARRSPRPTCATPTCRSSPTSTPLPTPRRRRVGRPAARASSAARCGGARRCYTLDDAGVHDLRRARPGHGAHRHGQAHADGRPAPCRSRTPDELDTLLEALHGPAAAAGRRPRGRAPLRHRAAGREPGRRRLRARPDVSDRALELGRRRRARAPSATTRSARRSPARIMGVLAVDGERVDGQPADRLAPDVGVMTVDRRGAHASRAGAPPCPTRSSPTPTSSHARHHRRVDPRAHRHPRAPRRRHHRRASPSRPGRPALDRGRRRPAPTSTWSSWPPPRPTSTCRPPRPPCRTQLGIAGGAFDVNAACSGFVYGLVTPHGLIAIGAERVLLIGADTMSRIIDWTTATPPSCSPTAPAPSCSRPSTAPASCSAGTSAPTAPRAHPAVRRHRRLHRDGRQRGLPAGGARHGRLGRPRRSTGRRHRRRHRPGGAPPGQHPHHRRRLPAARHPDRADRHRARPHRQHVVGLDPAGPRRRHRRRPGATTATSCCSSASAPA